MSKFTLGDIHHSPLTPLFTTNTAHFKDASTDALANLIYEALTVSPTTKISLWGLKNESQVRAFLDSPAGDTLFTSLASQNEIQLTNRENLLKAAQQKELLVEFIRSSYFLDEMEHKVHASGQKDMILLLNQQAINRAKPATSNSKDNPIRVPLQQILQNYNDALNLNSALLNSAGLEGKKLEALEQELLNQELLINSKYESFIKKLEEFEEQLMNLSGTDLDDLIEQIKISREEKLNQITSAIESDEDATELLIAHQILDLLLFSHENHLSVNRGDKYYADEEGREVDSADKAHFILDNHQNDTQYGHLEAEFRKSKIIKVDDAFYLLNPGESWDSIKDDETAKAQARNNYEYSKPNLLTVKKVLVLSKGRELESNKEQVQEVTAQKIKNQEVQSSLNNQAGILRAAIASAQNSIDNPSLGLTPPMPSVSANTSKNPTTAFRSSLRPEPKFKPLSEEQLAFRNQVLSYKGPYSERLKLELRLMPMNGPIPPLIMARMLQTMEAFGIDATKPAVTSIKNPLELTASPNPKTKAPLFNPQPKPSVAKDEEEPVAQTKSTPSPFKTDPYK